MDLSFPGFDSKDEVTQLPGDLAALLVGVAARQTDSVTARTQAGVALALVARPPSPAAPLDARLFAPLDGAFNGPMAAALTRWKDE